MAMNKLHQIITHPYFSYAYVFVIIFCIISLLFLPQGHPIVPYAVVIGVIMFGLHRYRRQLLKKRQP